MKTLKVMCFVALVLWLSTAQAYFHSGNQLKAKIDSNNTFEDAYAFGYIIGVADAINGTGYCPPSGETGVRAGQLQAVVKKYLNDSPERLHWDASLLTTIALGQTWPCSRPAAAPAPRRTPSKPKPKSQETSPF